MVALCCNSFSAMTLGESALLCLRVRGREALHSETQLILSATKDIHTSGSGISFALEYAYYSGCAAAGAFGLRELQSYVKTVIAVSVCCGS